MILLIVLLVSTIALMIWHAVERRNVYQEQLRREALIQWWRAHQQIAKDNK